MAVDVRRSADRYVTTAPWLVSRHSFSYGRHYDPGNTGHGRLVVCNEDVVRAGAGFDLHPHRDVEIVTWVLRGALVHEDTAGSRGVVRPGQVQRLSAGTGVEHSERADAGEDVHLVQAWVLPDEPGGEPDHEVRDVDLGGGLVPVVSGLGHPGVLPLRASAALHVGRLGPGEAVDLPQAPHVHLLVARGEVDLDGAGRLGQGDAARLTSAGPLRLTATAAAEVLVWETR